MPVSAPTELVFYQSTAAATSHTTAVSGSAQPIGTLVVVTGSLDGFSATNLTDTAGNTYTRSITGGQTGGTATFLGWSILTTAITTSTTWTVTCGSAGCCMSVQAFTGIAVSPLDQSTSVGTTTGTDLNSGNTAALTGSDDLLIGCCALNPSTLTTTPETLSPVWTGVTTNPLTNTVAAIRRLYTFWREQTGGGTPRFDSTTSTTIISAAAGIAAFKVQSDSVWMPTIRIPNRNVGPMALRQEFRQPQWFTSALTTQLFLQDLIANDVVSTASMQKQANKGLSNAVLITPTLQKQVNKVFTTTTVGLTATLQKQINKLFSSSTVGSTATIQKQSNKLLTSNVTSTASMQKQVNKPLSVNVAITPSMVKKVLKNLSTTVSITATMQTLKVILVNLLATVTSTASMQNQVNKGASANVVITPTMQKQINKALSTNILITPSMVKMVLKNLATTVGITASLQTLKVILVNLVATVTSTATMQKVVSKSLSANVVITPTIKKLISKTLTSTSSITAFLTPVFKAAGSGAGAVVHRLRISLTRFGFQ